MHDRLARGALLLALVGAVACDSSDGGQGPPPDGTESVFVTSDPAGARIEVDGRDTGLLTPDTVSRLTIGTHTVTVRMDTAGVAYGMTLTFPIMSDGGVQRVDLPLVARCLSPACLPPLATFHDVGGVRFVTNPLGMPFYHDGSGGGLLYPAASGNSYASLGTPVFAGFPSQGGPDPVSLGVYPFDQTNPTPYWTGRPAPSDSSAADRVVHRQSLWIVPPTYFMRFTTVRGLEIDQRLEGRNDVDGVVVIRVVFRNITDRASYRAIDSVIPAGGLVYDNAYVGFALDGDIGDATDDLVAYFPAQRTVVTYDADFQEVGFTGGASAAPALLGLRLLEAPPGATTTVLTSWPQSADWFLGKTNEPLGWSVLSASGSTRTGTKLGPVPTLARDYRMAVTAGPVRLAPGDSAVIRVAVLLAPPVDGTFTTGRVIAPGDPDDPDRPIARAAAALLAKGAVAEQFQP
ncbi:MAG: PEGA domain-containing protein [Gemmatimonadetes bacterium]|nr:PEGA domain-containing protein [Gemmatimonadota bacterium]